MPGLLATDSAPTPDPLKLAVVEPTPWRTVKEAARYCRCSQWKIKSAASSNLLRHSGGGQRGKPYMFRLEWLDEWMEHHR